MPSEVDNVISNGFCIGCGVCSLGLHENIKLNEYGEFVANITGLPESDHMKQDLACPFSNISPNEEKHASIERKNNTMSSDLLLGNYLGVWAGCVNDSAYRTRGSSGGLTSWILNTLLEKNLVDAVIHVKPNPKTETSGLLFSYQVSYTTDDVNLGAKSHYYPVELSKVLSFIRQTPGKYAITALPCFAKSLKSLMLVEPVFQERIKFVIGLFCGHLKSTGFAEVLAYQAGINPSKIKNIDFRTKIPEKKASEYAYTVSDGKRVVTMPMSDVIGKDWGMGLFKYKACDFCDDIFAEVADVAIGDAWLPEFVDDYRGTNILVTRNSTIHELVLRGIEQSLLSLREIPLEMAHQSQSANIRHRREDLPYRLQIETKTSRWMPTKRVKPRSSISSHRKAIQDSRRKLRDIVPSMWSEYSSLENKDEFFSRLEPLLASYKSLYQPRVSSFARLRARLRIKTRLRTLLSIIIVFPSQRK